MRAIGTVAAAAAFLALAGCDRLGPGAGAGGGNRAAGNEAAANDAAGKPAGEGAGDGNRADPGAGLGGKEIPGTARAGSAAAVALDRAYLLGRWTDDGACDTAVDFLADGRLVASNGREGLWTVAGDRLALTVDDETVTVQLEPIDQNSMTVVNPDGSRGRSTRC